MVDLNVAVVVKNVKVLLRKHGEKKIQKKTKKGKNNGE